LGADTQGVIASESGDLLARHLQKMMRVTGIPNGISGVGFSQEHVTSLAQAAVTQQRLLSMAPRPVSEQDLHSLYNDALSYW
jgi:hydroxyacid-oxoacid transhydrogenase